MFVRVAGPQAAPELVEPEDCKKFHVAYGGDAASPPAVVAEALGPWAAGADADHVWVRIDALRNAASGRVGSDWPEQFDAMVGYARTKGWLNDSGDAIAAHVEYT
jgi:hypothetical protein